MTIPQLLYCGFQFPGVIGVENFNLIPAGNEMLHPCNGLLRAFAGRWVDVPELRMHVLDHKSTPLAFDTLLDVGLEDHMTAMM